MSEVDSDDVFNIKSSRFRSSRFPGAVGGRIDAATSNFVAPGSVVAESSRAQSLGQLTPIKTPLTEVPESEPVEAPTLGDTVKGVGKAVGAGAAQFAGSTIGGQAGRALSTGASMGAALESGVSELGAQVSDLGTKAANFIGGGSSGGAAGASTSGGGLASNAGSAPASSLEASAGSDVTSASLGHLGAGVGAGLAAFGVNLLSGQSLGQSLKSGAATGAGTTIGLAVTGGNPIGGFIGGAIGGFFGCFVAGTQVLMENGTWKPVETIVIGDVLKLGGAVLGRGEMLCNDIYAYRGTRVSGSHAVFEDGAWLRVHDSKLAEKVETDVPAIVYPIATENCLMVLERFISADYAELWCDRKLSDDQIIAALNGMDERNRMIRAADLKLCSETVDSLPARFVNMSGLPTKKDWRAMLKAELTALDKSSPGSAPQLVELGSA